MKVFANELVVAFEFEKFISDCSVLISVYVVVCITCPNYGFPILYHPDVGYLSSFSKWSTSGSPEEEGLCRRNPEEARTKERSHK
ncbi:hypothetical protein LINGRAHAP2_LOCUS34519 [Linum grandiflorum]